MYDYYYNTLPSGEQWRNNLIYTSLISRDKKTFVQWYKNDSEYHKGKNQVVDQELMDDKFQRELHFLSNMSWHNPEMVPKILEVNIPERKIYLEIDGVDFWQRQLDGTAIPEDWQEQMLTIIQAHHARGWYKYSMHPSSYFVVDGKLKSINYFFTYSNNEGPISIADHQSHLSDTRKEILREQAAAAGLHWNEKYPLEILEKLCWESFRSNYPEDFIEKAKCIK
jgi:hypothetical protein